MSLISALFGRDRPPREVVAGLDRDDRVLAWATLDDGTAMVASRKGLWLPDREERLLPWYRIVRATWRQGVLAVTEGAENGGGVMEERPPVSYALAEPRRLPFTVRQRVENSIGYSSHHDLHPAGGVHVVGRRVAGRDGLTWYLVFDAGTDPRDPVLRVQADQHLDRARAATGL